MEIVLNHEHPRISAKGEGFLIFEGKALGIYDAIDFNKTLDWCRKISEPKVILIIKLKCLCMGSLRKLMQVFNTLDQNKSIRFIIVKWHFKRDDSDMIEKGKILSELYPEIRFIFKTDRSE